MNRRGFVGSVIGTVVGLSIPFVAQAAPMVRKLKSLERVRKALELFDGGEQAFTAGQLFLVLGDGTRIRGPKIKSTSVSDNGKSCKAVITAYPVNVTNTIIYKGMV